ncbi:hypothetical protein [Burkholderia diffusa]|uniref:hypothetical protein n=1 Tax=Burkholderia diffusa TaxID=488732 RepID=UPI002AAFD7D1|nr:hypothetical protein [Burkholderia diffusa]
MNDEIDWEAPIEPGRAMLGLHLGLSSNVVRKLIGCDGEVLQKTTRFRNSPKILIDCRQSGVIYFRAADMGAVEYDWQNILARLVFKQDMLESIVVESVAGGAEYAYKGKLLSKVGLGEKVAELLELVEIEFDDAEEVFYSDKLKGVEVAGDDSCNLSVNSNQVVTYIKVF